MRKLFYFVAFIAACALPLQSAAAVSTIAPATLATVNSHLDALSWLSGSSFQCEDNVVYDNGKSRLDKYVMAYSKPVGGWITMQSNGAPIGFIGYDPNNSKYVEMVIDKPGSYQASYMHLSGNSLVFESPAGLANVTAPTDTQTMTPSTAGYTAASSGGSDRYPGANYKDTTNCVRT
jgi:hypothetical protein